MRESSNKEIDLIRKLSQLMTKEKITKLKYEKSGFKLSIDKNSQSENFKTPSLVETQTKENDNLVVIGGALKDKVLDLDGIKNLASLPSLSEIQAKIIGLISAPARQIASVLATPAKQMITVTKAYDGVKEVPSKEEIVTSDGEVDNK